MLNSVLKREHSSLCYRLFNLSRARSPPQLIKTWKKTTLTWESEKTVLIKGADIQSGPQIWGCFSLSKTVCVIWGIKHSSSGFSPVRKWVQRRGFKFKSEDHSATAYGTIPTETLFRCCIFGVFFFKFFFFYTADPCAWKIKYTHYAIGTGLSGVCMLHVLILMFILILNCEVLWASLVGLGAI